MILLPALLFIGIMGLCIYLLDNQHGKRTKKASYKPIQVSTDNVTLIPAIYAEEEQEILSK